MIIYEVNLDVDADVAEAYRAWLRDHIGEMLTIDGFVGADWAENTEGEGDLSRWTVFYYLRDRRSLDDYFSQHADRMRRDGLERFPGKFKASRRVMERVERFGEEARSESSIES